MKKLVGILLAVCVIGSMVVMADDVPDNGLYAGGSPAHSACDFLA